MTAAMELDVDQRYETVVRFVSRLVKSFQNKYGGDWHELLSEANFAYAQAVKSYNLDHGTKFVTWVGRCIFDRFRELLRQRGKDHARRWAHVEGLESQTPDRKRFCLRSLLDEVSEDGATIIRLVLTTPETSPRTSPRSWRSRIVEHLYDLGWAAGRIVEAFGEIREALR